MKLIDNVFIWFFSKKLEIEILKQWPVFLIFNKNFSYKLLGLSFSVAGYETLKVVIVSNLEVSFFLLQKDFVVKDCFCLIMEQSVEFSDIVQEDVSIFIGTRLEILKHL